MTDHGAGATQPNLLNMNGLLDLERLMATGLRLATEPCPPPLPNHGDHGIVLNCYECINVTKLYGDIDDDIMEDPGPYVASGTVTDIAICVSGLWARYIPAHDPTCDPEPEPIWIRAGRIAAIEVALR